MQEESQFAAQTVGHGRLYLMCSYDNYLWSVENEPLAESSFFATFFSAFLLRSCQLAATHLTQKNYGIGVKLRAETL
jgi:hypothetical protein